MACPVYAIVNVYIGQVSFYNLAKKTRPCLIGHLVTKKTNWYTKNRFLFVSKNFCPLKKGSVSGIVSAIDIVR